MKTFFTVCAVIVTTCGAAAQDYALQFDAAQPQFLWTWRSLNHISNTFTMEMWVKPTATHEIDVEATTGYDGTSGQRYAISPNWFDTDESGAGISIGTNGVSVYEHAENYMPALLVWEGSVSGCTHIAVVYDAKTPKLYVNGVLVKTGLTSPRTNVHPSINHIGWGEDAYGAYSGMLDEIRVWDVALTEEQINDRMNTQITGSDPLWDHCTVYLPFREGRWAMTEDVSDADQYPKLSFLGSTLFSLGPDCPTWVAGRFNTSPIIHEPVNATRCAGEPVTFSVEATGTGLSYQWRKNGSPISGATDPTYTISSVSADDAGGYDVVVSGTLCPSSYDCVSCTSTPDTSRAAALTVLSALALAGPENLVLNNDPGQCGAVVNIPALFGDDVAFGMHIFSGTIGHLDKNTLQQFDTRTINISGISSAITSAHGLAMNPRTGEWFAVVGHDPGSGAIRSLVRIDPTTGTGSLIGATGINVSGIAFDDTGVLYAIGGSNGPGANKLYTLNISTGVPTFVMNVSTGGGRGFAYNPDDGLLYHKYYNQTTSTHGFEKIDPHAHSLTSITLSGLPTPMDVTGMMYEGDGVFLVNAVIWYRITTAGAITRLGVAISQENLKGLAVNEHPHALRVTGNCSPVSITQTVGLPSGSLFPIGTTTNTYIATDDSSNSAIFSFTVTVVDTESPAGICKSITTFLDESGHATISGSDLNDGSTDNCGIGSLSVEPSAFTCGNIGNNTVTLTVTDVHGNSSICEANVEVRDALPPVITVPSAPIELPSQPNKYAEYTVEELVSSVTDNCTSSPDVSIVWISSDEPDAGGTCGPKADDIIIASDCKSAQFRKERCSDRNGRVYNVYLKAKDESGNISYATYQVTVPKGTSPAVDDGADHSVSSTCGYFKNVSESRTPGAFLLEQNYPNPFNPSTTISYSIQEDGAVHLRVFDVHGRTVADLVHEDQAAGTYAIEFNGSTLPSGVYLYRLEAGSHALTGTMVLMK